MSASGCLIVDSDDEIVPCYLDVIFFNVPFHKKDVAKSCGARWNGEKRLWFVKSDDTKSYCEMRTKFDLFQYHEGYNGKDFHLTYNKANICKKENKCKNASCFCDTPKYELKPGQTYWDLPGHCGRGDRCD